MDGLCPVRILSKAMSSKWLRSSDDVSTRFESSPGSVLKILRSRERGDYANCGKQFDFIAAVYYRMFPTTTPRYILVDRSGASYKTLEFKFHPHCKHGC